MSQSTCGAGCIKTYITIKVLYTASSLVFDTTWIHDYEVEEYLLTNDLLKSLLPPKSAREGVMIHGEKSPAKSMVDIRFRPWTETNVGGDGGAHP
jgi:hypothetical protein